MNTTLRLTGGKSESEGNVELFHEREWRFICDDYWDIRDAKVVCRQLRFTEAVIAQVCKFDTNIFVDNLLDYNSIGEKMFM